LRREIIGNCELYLGDCMDLMKQFPDNHFDLAITDPPYGNNDAIGLKNGNGHIAERKDYKLFKNTAPNADYFNELKRVSKNRIICGGNYFGLAGGYICWWKHGTAFGECELIYCSMINSVKLFDYTWNGMLQENMKNKETRIHPTQKPISLYKWLLSQFTKPGNKIIDTHMGSGSIAIACNEMNVNLTAIEIDPDYFNAACDRIKAAAAQGLFDFGEPPESPPPAITGGV